MAEKLEKSEAGRKKLRQAITMLKEKMEATEKVLQVNETLRQGIPSSRAYVSYPVFNSRPSLQGVTSLNPLVLNSLLASTSKIRIIKNCWREH